MNEYADIQKLLSELPEITLPQSLTAESLFARMDGGTLSAEPEPATKKSNRTFVDFTRRYRPAMSYAAAFALLVLVYYGAGMSGGAPAPMAAPQMASPMEQNAPPEMAVAPQSSAAIAPEAVMEALDEIAAPQAENGPELRSAAAPEQLGATFAFYADLAAELRKTPADEGASAAPQGMLAGTAGGATNNATLARSEGLLYRHEAAEDGSNSVVIYNDKTGARLGDFAVATGDILELIPMDKNLLVLAQVPYSEALYSGDATTPIESGPAEPALLPDCGAVLVTSYSVADPAKVTTTTSFAQEGSYRGYNVRDNALLIFSIKSPALPQLGGALLGNLAPMVSTGNNNVLTRAVDPQDVYIYPQGGKEEYLLLSNLRPAGGNWRVSTKVVLGSGLGFQPGGKTNFVLSEAATSGSKALDTFLLDDMTIEMR